MPTIIVNDLEVEIGPDEQLNGIQAAERAGVEIPHYCWHPGLSVVASCRMCLVETGRKDPESGEINLIPKLVPACQTPATDGTVFVTNSQKVIDARAMVEEDLLIRHPIDCPICDKAGECSLQDYHFEHGREERRADINPFTSRRRSLGETVTLFVDRCVMCSRCVRFCREITETSELMVTNRGTAEEIDVFPGFPLENKMSGNVVDLCPVGALGDKDFLYEQRVWFIKKRPHVCAGCSTGCSINVEENQDQIYRLKPRDNPHINQWWMCDEGRYGWKHVHHADRQVQAYQQQGETVTPLDGTALVEQLSEQLSQAGPLAVVLSPHLTVEEAYLLAQYARGVDAQARLILGHVPVQGEDETYPAGFTIHAEKCPNRRGVEEVIAGIAGEVTSWETFVQSLPESSPGGVWITGGYKSNWHDADMASRFQDVPLLIVQDTFTSPLAKAATYNLPATTFAEQAGSFVNHADHLQSFEQAIRPPAGVIPAGQLYWRLLNRPGLYQSPTVLAEIAREIPYFNVAVDPPGELGVDLKLNHIAS